LLPEQERLIREVGIKSPPYTELKNQLEITKIEEINPALAGRLFTPFTALTPARQSARLNEAVGQGSGGGLNGVNVMDEARAATRKEKPKRSTIALVIFFPYCY
jgi:hypothetical protein